MLSQQGMEKYIRHYNFLTCNFIRFPSKLIFLILKSMPIVVIKVGEKESFAYRRSKHVLPTPTINQNGLRYLSTNINKNKTSLYRYLLSLKVLFAYQKDYLYRPFYSLSYQ